MTKPSQYRVPETICLIGLVVFPCIAAGQARVTSSEPAIRGPVIPAAIEKPATPAQGISYANGQLMINVSNSTLADVLAKVAALTGANIDVPEAAHGEEIPTLELGPGPARQIVTALLGDSSFDYLIQGSDADPDKIQSVLLMPRGKKDNIPDGPVRPGRGPFARAAVAPAPPQDVPAPEPPVADQTAAAGANPPSAQPAEQPAPAAQPDLSAPPVYGQPLQTNVPKTFPVAPPTNMDQQSVNQTLLQMYQQRSQMAQQERQQAAPATPENK